MGIIASLEQRGTYGLVGPPRDPVIAEWMGAGNRSASGVSVTPDASMKVTAVFRCVQIRAQTIASLPLGVYRMLPNGGHQLDVKHPLHSVLTRSPNKWQTSFEWREMMEGHFSLRGRCYSEIVSTGSKGVAELIPLHPDRVTPFRAPDGRLAFYYTPENGPARVILQSEMHFVHGMTTGPDGITPLSPIGECREAIGLSMATEHHGATLFGNGTKIGGIVRMKGHMKDDETRRTFMKSFNEAFRGVQNANKTALFEDGMEWQQLGMNNEDAQFITTREFQLAEICRIFGIPPHKIFDLSRSTNNNIEHQGIEFVQDTVRPMAVRREEAMERDLLSGTTHSIMFDLDGLMRGDSASRASFYNSALQNGYLTRNEVRVLEGNNPIQAEGMDSYTVQLNMTTVDKIGVDPAPAPTNTRELDAISLELRTMREQMDKPAVPPVINVDARSTVNQAPAAPVTVNMPEIRQPDVLVDIAPTTVNVSPPNVTVNQGETRVNIEPPEVNLEATLPTPTVVVSLPPRRTDTTVERDADGNIVSTTQIEKDA